MVVAVSQRLDNYQGAVRNADYGLRPPQALEVADGDVRVSRAEHAEHQLRALLSALRQCEGRCRAGMPDGPRVEVLDLRGPDDVVVPCGPQMFLLIGAPDQRGGVGPSRLLPLACGADGV